MERKEPYSREEIEKITGGKPVIKLCSRCYKEILGSAHCFEDDDANIYHERCFYDELGERKK